MRAGLKYGHSSQSARQCFTYTLEKKEDMARGQDQAPAVDPGEEVKRQSTSEASLSEKGFCSFAQVR